MQPPPRKVKVTQELKNTLIEQMTRLHLKHQTECDLLEDMRAYSLKKGQLERDYVQALQKLASQYLKRDWPGIKPEDQGTDYRNVYAVWRSYLKGTVQVTQSRINVCDNYKNEISDPAKTVRLYKEQQLNKSIEQLNRIQVELQDSVKDLAKAKKKYYDSEQVAQAVREKADIEAKSKLGLFQSRISLQKANVKLKAKRSDCNSKATHARNDYLLTLAAANAHHDRYYHTDLLHCIQELDGGIYNHVKDYLISICQTELEAFQVIHNTFQFLLDKSTRVMQEFNQQLFMQENPVFHKAQDFQFQPSDCDTTVKLKAEARLDLLRQVGVAVDTWLKSAMNQVMEELENERWATLNYTTHDPSLSGPVDLERSEGEECEENMEVFDDSSSSPSGTLRNYPLTCKVLYSYKASQPDELSIEEHEMLEVIEDGDMEDWVKARSKTGLIGYVPEKYLQFPTSSSLLSMLQSLAALDARSHTSSNSTEPEIHTGSINGDASLSFVRALYDYDGQADEELSFPEGAVIRLLNRDTQTDDGFWEGEFNGRVGVFPSVLVEDLTESRENSVDKLISPSSRLPSSLPPLPLYDQPPCSPYSTPDTPTPPPLPRSPSVNGEHKPPPTMYKGPTHNHSPVSPEFPQPSRFTPDGGISTLRPVRAAPPPPKQKPHKQTEKTEEVEITLV
ncbi:F-BAR and double SH3 domains protein 2 isoform X4 [Oncorhynchus mykiss]|uniref:F-BAR and double SH3 domains protein 2 isoform X4 n=1 Tax=Oncorhynchus mykiss TaxID=8022 RepID=UPI0018783445|nr:F-BAR and double SH3 domains protein 2 isoform X4 [Oncorhynchus mykiss]